MGVIYPFWNGIEGVGDLLIILPLLFEETISQEIFFSMTISKERLILFKLEPIQINDVIKCPYLVSYLKGKRD
ncbi:MAG: hypothetical protein DRN12_02255 [Thermoplasmata archaeon]|nr:MAG: hypothetical protein DRN12_02255 [Thermoplasmata archaeon]